MDAHVVAAERPLPDPGALVAAAREGDVHAFSALYRRFAPLVHGIALTSVGPRDADDVVQETFVRIHARLHRLRNDRSLFAWIRSVARNVARDRLRRRARRPVTLVEPDRLPAPPLHAGDDRVLRDRVLARLQELPEAYRETLVWRLVEGLSGPEIAARTGLSPGSVRVNLCRGLARLRSLLEKEGWR